ncbi:MAG: type I phosphomannose isomerase catalytic subunit [Eubacteriales bacterium]
MRKKNMPVLLESKLFTHLWGGSLLKENLNKKYSDENVGESWEVSAHPKGNSTIASGEYAGMAFGEYYKKVLGNKAEYPLLIKLIGPKKDLSVQVHPDDAYAKVHENSLGKKEAWYVLSAPEGGKLIAGVNCTKEEFKEAVENGKAEKTLNYLNCKKGDFISIDSGLVHALLADVIVYEVQQNSDITYRIYDWDRVDEKTKQPRELHVEKAFEVIDFEKSAKMERSSGADYQMLTDNEYFSLSKINFEGEYKDSSKSSGAYTIIKGQADVCIDNEILFSVSKGDSFYAPYCNNFTILGKGEMLKSTEK